MSDDSIRQLREDLGVLSGRVRDHAVLLAQNEVTEAKLGQVAEQLADLQIQVGLDEGKGKGYKPVHTPRWWDLGEQEKEAEVGRVRGWYNDIAVPFLGTRGLPKCVMDHDIALMALDPVCEAWKAVWLNENRTAKVAAGQCEFILRIWPGIKSELTKALSGCDHQSGMPLRQVAS